ncbi:hypothetical protein [Brevundimonas diminuta]|jgi:SM-20-related protein|uniref:hypothetical protein n=1 Tax=Brevundimonas diminuta TaxID=293 RepID=UPI003D9A2A29
MPFPLPKDRQAFLGSPTVIFRKQFKNLFREKDRQNPLDGVTVWIRGGGGNGRETVKKAVITKKRPSERLRRISSEFTFKSVTYRHFRKRYQKLPKGLNHSPLVIDRTSRPPSAEAPVEVWDGAVPLDLQIRLAGLMDLNIWRYGWKASHEQTAYGFWHSHFGGDDNEAGITDCEHDLVGRPLIAPVLELWRMLQAGPLEGHAPVRVYANGHTFGGDGHLHRDHTAPGHFTTIYYAHQEWRPNWAGETVFFNEAGDEIVKAVYPKPGRLAHFPGRIQHAARSPSRECPALRSVVVFKSRLIGEAS